MPILPVYQFGKSGVFSNQLFEKKTLWRWYDYENGTDFYNSQTELSFIAQYKQHKLSL